MGALEQLAGFEMSVAEFVGPIILVFFMLAFGKFFLKMVDEFVAGMIFRVRGYRIHDTVKINNASATISKIGLLSTHFQILNGDEYVEYVPVSNSRLDFADVRLVVEKPKRVERLKKDSG